MPDYFALLDEPRRPWLDIDSLKAKFLARSAQIHPDRVHAASDAEKTAAAQRYAELNAAFNCLHEPKDRLAHLLQLELGAKPQDLQQMPDDLVETFMKVAQLCRDADAFLAEKARITSPLLQAQLFERSQEHVEKISALQAAIAAERDALMDRLRTLDAEWNSASCDLGRSKILLPLEEIYRLLSFFARWTHQLQERLVQFAV